MNSLEAGIEFFNQKKFWEAHEAWETQWRQLEGEERICIQGLIQLCGGLFHLQKGRLSPALKLFRSANQKIAGLSSSFIPMITVDGLGLFLSGTEVGVSTDPETLLKKAGVLRAKLS